MKKGFTLIELLAVIIVLGIVGMIAVGVVSNSINSSKKKTFEINASNLLDAAKEYVTKSMENNDFPEGGIEANNKELGIKNNPFISGIIKRNEEGQIVLINVSDGKYCANGPKSNIEITEGNCEATDDDPPTLKIKEVKTTSTRSEIMITTQDSVSGVEKYTYCIAKIEEDYKEEDCVIVEKNKEKKLIKEIKEIEQLETVTNYKVKVTVKDGKGNETTKEIQITTKEIEEPEFKISTTTYALTKKLTIIYPEVDERYTKYYQIGEEKPQEETDLEKTLEIKENVKVKAYITKEDKEIVSNEIIITGIDQEGPSVKVEIQEIDNWRQNKTMTINATDEGVGLALKPYKNNGFGEEYSKWNREKKVTLTSSGKLNIKARDRLGNINKTFKLNGEDCNVDVEPLCAINKIDSVGPKIEIEVIEGTKINNEKYNDWYNSDSVKVQIKITDYYLYNGEEVEGGSGVNEKSLTVNVTNKVNNKVNNKQTTEQFTPTKIVKNVYQINLTKSGENKIEVSVSDNVGNIGTAEKTVKIDNVTPTIKAKVDPLELDKSKNYTFTDNTISKFGPTGGTVNCDPSGYNTKTTEFKGRYEVTCTATGTNGKKILTEFNVIHWYAAIGHQEKCEGDHTYKCVNPTNCKWNDRSDGGKTLDCSYSCGIGDDCGSFTISEAKSRLDADGNVVSGYGDSFDYKTAEHNGQHKCKYDCTIYKCNANDGTEKKKVDGEQRCYYK